tara:strand:+ start:9346 stop:10122 length:777 start_codon:yes stop_codon:yes gene_type:complete
VISWEEADIEFSRYVDGKTLAIVGPSETAVGLGEGDTIDSFDIVARVKSFMYPDEMKADLGTRSDILYTTEARDRVDIKKYETYRHPTTGESTYRYEKFDGFDQYSDLKFVVSTYPRDEWFSDRYFGHLDDLRKSEITKCRFVNSPSYFRAKEKTDRPNSGFSSIVDILSFDIKSLHIFGLDFHRAMYRKDYQNSLYTHETIRRDTIYRDGIDSHQPDLQYQYFKYEMWKKDKRIKPNQSLLRFLSNDSYDCIYGEAK